MNSNSTPKSSNGVSVNFSKSSPSNLNQGDSNSKNNMKNNIEVLDAENK